MNLQTGATPELKASLDGLMFDSMIDNFKVGPTAVKSAKADNFSTEKVSDKNRSDIRTDFHNDRHKDDYGQVKRNQEKHTSSNSSEKSDAGFDSVSVNKKTRSDSLTTDTKNSSSQHSDTAGLSENNAVNNPEDRSADNSQDADKMENSSSQAGTAEAVSEPVNDGLLVKILGSLAEDTIETPVQAEDTIETSGQAEDIIETLGRTEKGEYENNALQNNDVEQSEALLSNSNVNIVPDNVVTSGDVQKTAEINNAVFDDALYHVIKEKALNEGPAGKVQQGLEKAVINESTEESNKAEAFKTLTPESGDIKNDGPKTEGPEHVVIAEEDVVADINGSKKSSDTANNKNNSGDIDIAHEAGEVVSKTDINKNSVDNKNVISEIVDEKDPDAVINNKDNYKNVENRYSEKNIMHNNFGMQETGDDAASVVSRFMSGLMVNADRENGSKSGKGNIGSQVRAVSANTNSAVASSHGVIQSNGEIAQIHQTAALARPAALNELVDKIVYTVKGENNLGVTIKHEELGNINIRLTLEKGMVNIHINAPDKAVREMLESNIQSLVNSLEENGVSVGGFSVALQNNGNNSGYAEGNNKGYFSNDLAERENDTVPVKVDKARGLVNIFA